MEFLLDMYSMEKSKECVSKWVEFQNFESFGILIGSGRGLGLSLASFH